MHIDGNNRPECGASASALTVALCAGQVTTAFLPNGRSAQRPVGKAPVPYPPRLLRAGQSTMRSIASAQQSAVGRCSGARRTHVGAPRPVSVRGLVGINEPFAWRVARYFRQLLRSRRRTNPHVVARYAGFPRTTTRTQVEGAAIAAHFKVGGEIAAATRHRRQAVSKSDGVVLRPLRLRCARPSSAVLPRIVLSLIRAMST